jgi:NADH-quinone oxidoreductase subunit G
LDRYGKFVVRYAYGDEIETVSGLAKKDKIGEALQGAENLVVLYGSDGLGLDGSTALAAACAELVKGRVGKPNNGLVGVWPRANDQGAWEMGFETSDDLAEEIKGKTVYVAGADPAGDDPALAKALKASRFLVVQDISLTATAGLADVVLPAQAYTEREGTFTSGERRVQRYYPAVPVTGEARPDFAITSQIARQMGYILEGTSPAIVFDFLVTTIKSFEGLDYARLAEVTGQWPIVGRSDMYYGGTTYENKQGLGVQLTSAADRGESYKLPAVKRIKSLRPKEGEVLAVPVTKLYDQGTTVIPAELLSERIGEPHVVFHPATAKELAVDGGELVKLSWDGGQAEVRVRIDEGIPTGVALVPRSFGVSMREPVLVSVKSAKKVK